MEKNNTMFIIWLLIVVIIILVVVFTFIFLNADNEKVSQNNQGNNQYEVNNKNLNNENSDNNFSQDNGDNTGNSENVVDLKLDSDLVKKLYSYIDNSAIGYTYSESNFTDGKVSDELKVRLGFYKLVKDGKAKVSQSDENYPTQYISKSDMDAAISQIFENSDYTPKEKVSLTCLSGYSPLHDINFENGKFSFDNILGGGFPAPIMVQYLTSARQVGNSKVELFTRIYFVDYVPDEQYNAIAKVYKNCLNYATDSGSDLLFTDELKVVESTDERKLASEFDKEFGNKLNQYKITFKIVNENYYLTGIEKVN